MQATLKAGKYYVGDPCYIFDKSWDKIIQDTSCFTNDIQFIEGEQVLIGGTAYGDGSYVDNNGFEYGVDAGVIGILPVSLFDLDRRYDGEKMLGNIITFDNDFEATIENGIFDFGDIHINTQGVDPETLESELLDEMNDDMNEFENDLFDDITVIEVDR
jgi:hypothetical protein